MRTNIYGEAEKRMNDNVGRIVRRYLCSLLFPCKDAARPGLAARLFLLLRRPRRATTC